MRILFNLASTLGQRTGIGHYAAELFRCLKSQAAPDTMIGFPTRWKGLHDFLHRVIGRVGGPLRARKERLLAEPAAVGFLPRLWQRWRRLRLADRACVAACLAGQLWMERHYRKCLSPPYTDLYHEPNYIPMECDLPAVITVCDLSALLHPQWHPVERVAFFEQNFHKGLAQCVHILTISEFSRREIVGALGIAPERITCTYLAPRRGMRPLTASEGAAALRRLGLSWRGYLLYVGTLEPRKNVETLLRAYCDLPAERRQRCPLVLAGGWGWRAENLRALFESEARHKGVLHVGYVAEADLPALYSGARALAFPSLYEGFGLPPVEMLACSGAVLASTADAVAEVLQGSSAHLIEPLDVAAWRDALAGAIGDDDWLAGLRAGACDHAARFTWDACAQATLRAYRTLKGVGLDAALTRGTAACDLRAAG